MRMSNGYSTGQEIKGEKIASYIKDRVKSFWNINNGYFNNQNKFVTANNGVTLHKNFFNLEKSEGQSIVRNHTIMPFAGILAYISGYPKENTVYGLAISLDNKETVQLGNQQKSICRKLIVVFSSPAFAGEFGLESTDDPCMKDGRRFNEILEGSPNFFAQNKVDNNYYYNCVSVSKKDVLKSKVLDYLNNDAMKMIYYCDDENTQKIL